MVKQILNKVVAMFIILVLTMGNLLLVATQSYAEFEELEEQKRATSDKNVSFDTYFFVDEKNVHSVTLETSNEAIVNFEINVGEGYLKDSKIELNNPNFEIISIENQSVEGIVSDVKANQIILNQISSNTRIIVSARIKINHKEMVEVDFLGRETNVIFTSNYTNIKGKTKQINSNIVIRVDWTSEANSIIDTNVEKYMFLNNKTIIQTKVISGINENVLPIKSTYIKAISPQIDGVNAQDIRVSAVNTIATNGIVDGNSFSKENYTYNKETGIVEINVDNTPNNENKISWKNGTDEYIVTYIYDGTHNISNIDLNVTNNITTYKNTQITNEIKKTQEITISGNNVDFELKATENLSKGYMYANSYYETEYVSNWNANVSYIDGTDTLIFQQNTDKFVKADGKTEYVNSYYKQTKINKLNFEKLLGEEGQAEIYSGENLIGTINKNSSLDENGNYVYNYGEPISNIMVKTTKPVSEGKIVIENVKAITAIGPYSINQLREFLSIENSLVGSSLNQDVQDLKVNTNLTETSTKANIQIGKENLSTVVNNEDVEIRAVLKADDITDDLYRNPTIEINLPEEVENINLKSANVLFTNEMEITKIEIVNNHIIRIGLTGEQTNFVTDGNKGITIIINTDITLFKTAASKETQVTMKYSNEKAIRLENDGISSTNLAIVAPTGVIALNSVTNTKTGESATSLGSEKKEAKLQRNSETITATYNQTVINNEKESVKGMKLLGRIGTEGDDLGSTISPKLTSTIGSIENIDYTVYYSEKADATEDLQNSENGWTQEANQNIKSYLIFVNKEVAQGEELNFGYNIEIPGDLEYGANLVSTYSIEYNTQEDTLNKEATQVSLSTGNGPVLEATLEDNTVDGTVYVGDIVGYTISITNNGTADAENVKINVPVPEGMVYTELNDDIYDVENKYIFKDEIKEIEINIGNMEKGENIKKEFLLYAKEENNEKMKAKILSSNFQDFESNEIKINTKKSSLSMIFETNQNSVIENDIVGFNLTLDTDETINDLNIKINLPEGIEFKSASAYDYVNDKDLEGIVNYNEKEKNIEISIEKLEKNTIIISVTVNAKNNQENMKVYAVANYAGKEQISNFVKVSSYKLDVNVDSSSSIQSGSYVKVSEEIQYTITIENKNKTKLEEIYPSIKLPNEIVAEKVYMNDNELSENDYTFNIDENKITFLNNIDTNEKVKILITAKVSNELNLTEDKQVTTNISIEKLNYIKNFNYIIEKNAFEEDDNEEPENPEEPGDSDEDKDNENPGNSSTSKTYKISGTAWLDSDKNGKMENTEIKLSGITAKAVNTTGNIITTTTTSEDGIYTLDNLPIGEYTIIFDYDTSKYLLTTYQAEGVEESLNSNVVNANLEGKSVATTNTIHIADRSIANINIGLVEGSNFDLSLSKKVTQISIANTKTSKTKDYDTNLAKIDLDYKYINNTKVAVEYEITVTNEGDIPGYATKIVDYLPKEFDFSTELNKDWYSSGNNIETKALADKIINPGERVSITLILTKSMTENDNGIVCNTAEIAEDYNEYGQADSDSKPGNNIENEDDQSSANVILGLRTGGPVTYITLTITIMVLICVGAYEINKRVLKI